MVHLTVELGLEHFAKYDKFLRTYAELWNLLIASHLIFRVFGHYLKSLGRLLRLLLS
jgi:hypothetical protein